MPKSVQICVPTKSIDGGLPLFALVYAVTSCRLMSVQICYPTKSIDGGFVAIRARLRRYIMPADVSANLFSDKALFNVVTLRTCLRRYTI